MEIFVVGGAVRDTIMNNSVKDVDFVVVGASHEDMVSKGFKQVGIDFPVYLHPETGDEYALARTERKVAAGYNGFTCKTTDVTLIQDLSRRDITINSMAVRFEDWEQFKITKCPHLVVDPFWGQADIACKVIVHTTEAFKCDPIRVLRVARFAARYGFTVQDETTDLMSRIVHELEHIPTERIWLEFEKGLTEPHAHKMIEVLHKVGAFDVEIMKPFQRNHAVIDGVTRVEMLQRAAHINHLPSRFALIGHDFRDVDFKTHRIPNDCVEMSKIINKFGATLSMFNIWTASHRLKVIMEMRAMQRSDSFIHQIMDVVDIMFPAAKGVGRKQFFRDLKDISRVDAAAVAQKARDTFNPDNIWTIGFTIQWAIFNARLDMMDIDKRNLVVPGQ